MREDDNAPPLYLGCLIVFVAFMFGMVAGVQLARWYLI